MFQLRHAYDLSKQTDLTLAFFKHQIQQISTPHSIGCN